MTQHATLAGLRIESDFSLIGLGSSNNAHAAFGRLRILRVDAAEFARRASAQPHAISMQVLRLGSFLIAGPGEILVVPEPGTADRSLFAYLFGPCFAVVAYLNRLLPLHASAIETTRGCVSFVGPSGAGKSTVVAALARRGHVIHSDDVCLLRTMPDERMLSWPGIRWLRLTQGAATALQYEQSTPVAGGRKHQLLLAPLAESAAPRMPHAIYVLQAGAHGEPASLSRLRGALAAERVIANAYRPQLAHRLGLWPQAVRNCVELAERTPVFIFRRPLDFSQMDRTLDVLERHIDGRTSAHPTMVHPMPSPHFA